MEDFKNILIQNKDNMSSTNISEQIYNMTFDNFNNYINIISAINEQNINQFGTLFLMNILSYFYQLLSKFDLKGVKGKELELFNILGNKLYTISSYHYNKVKKLETTLNLISKDSYYSEEINLYRFLQIFHFNSKSEKIKMETK